MSDVNTESFPVVNIVKPSSSQSKGWVNFNANERAEEIVGTISEINQNYKISLEDDEKIRKNESSSDPRLSSVHLPAPPRPNRQSNNDKHHKHNQNDKHHSNKSSRSSTPYLSSSPNSSFKINQINSKDKSADRSGERSNDKQLNDKPTKSKDDCALNIPESFIKSNSGKLQNIPLKDSQDISTNVFTTPSLNSSNQSTSRFKNGDVLVSLLPLNTRFAWITPAIFKPELVPEELMSPEFKLTVEDYVQAIQMLVNDYRFNMYIVFYKKITIIWLILGFCILFSLLFSNASGIVLFFGIIIWALINAFGFLLTQWMKIKMIRNLERCLARVNEHFYKSNILLAVDDKGKLSCHKINLIFIYFDGTECIKHLNNLLNRDGEVDSINNTISNLNELNNNSNNINLNKYGTASQSINMIQQDVEISDIIITGPQPTRLTQKDKYGEKLFLRYSQRWAKDFLKERIGFSTPLHYDASISQANIEPRHCEKARCLCQYVEEHLSFKPNHHCGFKDIFG